MPNVAQSYSSSAYSLMLSFIANLHERCQEANQVLVGDSKELWQKLGPHALAKLELLSADLSRLAVYSDDDFRSIKGAVKRTLESIEVNQDEKGLDYVEWLARAPQVMAERLEARALVK